jgi:hypothetical protein
LCDLRHGFLPDDINPCRGRARQEGSQAQRAQSMAVVLASIGEIVKQGIVNKLWTTLKSLAYAEKSAALSAVRRIRKSIGWRCSRCTWRRKREGASGGARNIRYPQITSTALRTILETLTSPKFFHDPPMRAGAISLPRLGPGRRCDRTRPRPVAVRPEGSLPSRANDSPVSAPRDG